MVSTSSGFTTQEGTTEPSNTQTERRTSKRKRSPTMDSKNGINNNDDNEDDPSYEPSKKTRPDTRGKASPTSKGNDIKKLEAEIRKWKNKSKDQQKQLVKVTTESILNARRGSKEIWDLTKIETEFKNVNRDIKNWIKKYGITRQISSLPDAKKKEFLSECRDVSAIYFSVFAENDFSAIETLSKGAYMLLEGFLFAWTCSYLIQRRFIFLDEALKDHNARPKHELLQVGNYEEKFDSFAAELGKVSPYQNQKWMTSTLQALKPIMIPDYSSKETQSGWANEKRGNGFLKKYDTGLSSLVTDFLKSPARYVLSCPQGDRKTQQREELRRIFRKFRELAYHMWCQPSHVSYEYRTNLAQFDPDTMELDFRATMGRPDNAADRLRGDRVLININPAIVGVVVDPDSNEHTRTTYLKHKVWTVHCQSFSHPQKAAKEENATPADDPIPEQGLEKDDSTNDGQDDSAALERKDHRFAQVEAMSCENDDIVAPEQWLESNPAGRQIVNPTAIYYPKVHGTAQHQMVEPFLRDQQANYPPTHSEQNITFFEYQSRNSRQQYYTPASASWNDFPYQLSRPVLQSVQDPGPSMNDRQYSVSPVTRLLAVTNDAMQDYNTTATYNTNDRGNPNTIPRSAPTYDATGYYTAEDRPRYDNASDDAMVLLPTSHPLGSQWQVDETSTEEELDDDRPTEEIEWK
ncbi:hypothetical protein UA08_07294 [Talaromyces atroroseus]|uniref:Uncharacterized protein n=1 Tax=Talaromyces atroroseus TaxID=1441469 RepID=A0A225A9Y0_TALAT|nr:hypothetical protein UA08_07294 [Talaromyces atroroseus]OKL57612.1 hypothetical protein UA08_07294 [Talaromyces atroroseus]